MRRYEVVFVLAPTLSEEEADQQVEAFSAVATEQGASVQDVAKWGKKHLAYPIDKHREGYYTILTLEESEGAAVSELERRFRVTDSILRFLAVRIDHDLKLAAKREQHREHRIQNRAARPAPEQPAVAAAEE